MNDSDRAAGAAEILRNMGFVPRPAGSGADAVCVHRSRVVVAAWERYRKDQASLDGDGNLLDPGDGADNRAVRAALETAEEVGKPVLALGLTGTPGSPSVHAYIVDPSSLVPVVRMADPGQGDFVPDALSAYMSRRGPAGPGDLAGDSLLTACRGLRRDIPVKDRDGRNALLALVLMARLGGLTAEEWSDPDAFRTRAGRFLESANVVSMQEGLADIVADAAGTEDLGETARAVNRRFGPLDRRNSGRLLSAFVWIDGDGVSGEMVDGLALDGNRRVFDPICGDGRLLMAVHRRISRTSPSNGERILGMEADPVRFAVAVTNLVLAGCRHINLVLGGFPDDAAPFRRRTIDNVVSDMSSLDPASATSRIASVMDMAEPGCPVTVLAPSDIDTEGLPVTGSEMTEMGRILRMGAERKVPKTATAEPAEGRDPVPAGISTDDSRIDSDMAAFHRLRTNWTYIGCGGLFRAPAAPPKTFLPKEVPLASFPVADILAEEEPDATTAERVPMVAPRTADNGWTRLEETDGPVHRADRVAVFLEGGRVRATYQPAKFVADGRIIVFGVVGTRSPYAVQYVVSRINAGGWRSLKAFVSGSIALPVKAGRPDYNYMANRAKFAESEYIASLEEEE